MKKKSLTGSGIERMGKEFDYFFREKWFALSDVPHYEIGRAHV